MMIELMAEDMLKALFERQEMGEDQQIEFCSIFAKLVMNRLATIDSDRARMALGALKNYAAEAYRLGRAPD